MAVYMCKKCGGDLRIIDQASGLCKCEYCRSTQTIPSDSNEKKDNLYNTANKYRCANKFDLALGIYQTMIKEYPEEAESYWGAVLCRYGIEYVEDPRTKERIPTCHRTVVKSIFEDPDYILACEKATYQARTLYEQEAKEIDRIQKKIISLAAHEEPFDIFISYKELNDSNGQRTRDSVIAQDLYQALSHEGYKVFFSRITLENRLGEDYEPIIYSALNSSKVMLLVGTSNDNMNAPWVRNEWSRYLDMMDTEPGKKYLIPVYKDMDPYDIPKEITGRHIQAQDASKIGYHQDLIRGIHKIISMSKKTASPVDFTGVGSDNANAIIERGFICLQDGRFEEAEKAFDQSLNVNPHAAGAYLGRLMVRRRMRSLEDLGNESQSLSGDIDYRHAMEYADSKLKKELRDIEKSILNNSRRIAELAVANKKDSLKSNIEELAKEITEKEEMEKQADIIIDNNTAILEEKEEKVNKMQGIDSVVSSIIVIAWIIMYIYRICSLWSKGSGFLGKAGAVISIIIMSVVFAFVGFLVYVLVGGVTGSFVKVASSEYAETEKIIEKAKQAKDECLSVRAKRDVLEQKLNLLNNTDITIIDSLSKLNSDAIETTLSLSLESIEAATADDFMTKIEEIVEQLSVDELNDLVNACEEKFDVSTAADVVAAEGSGAAAEEEKDSFNVELTEVGPNKIKVIKVVREMTGLGLKEAKEAVEATPKVLKEQIAKDEAESAKNQLEEVGAKVTLK